MKLIFSQTYPFRICLILLFSCISICNAQNPKKPNFIVILTDDQSWVGTSFLTDPKDSRSKSDYYQTPNMKRLAESGMRMTNGYAPAPFCSPTRKSILTGLTPAKHEYQKDRENWTTSTSVAKGIFNPNSIKFNNIFWILKFIQTIKIRIYFF